MNINVSYLDSDKRIALIELSGELDARSFSKLMQKSKQAHDSGAHFLLLDLSKLGFMSSSGLSALHSMSLLMQDVDVSHKEIRPDQTGDDIPTPAKIPLNRVKIINPQSRVMRTLEMSGFCELYEIYTDLPRAVNSCHADH